MIEETAAKKASYDARQKVSELRQLMSKDYPDDVDQTYYHLIMSQIDTLLVLTRLAGEVEE